MPEEAVRRQHELAGHLGHAPWCDVCWQARARNDLHQRTAPVQRVSEETGVGDQNRDCRMEILSQGFFQVEFDKMNVKSALQARVHL